MRRLLSIALVVLAAACDSTAPEDPERPEDELTFARFSSETDADVAQASFYAVRGQTRTLAVRYRGQAQTDPPLLEFVVGPLSLLTRSDGRPFLAGDSVRITVTVDTQRRFVFDFQPSGLLFSPLDPALLRINYGGADDDLNRDGLVNQLDAVLEARLRIWQQTALGLPWLPVPTVRLSGQQRVEGRVTHFTGFALAS